MIGFRWVNACIFSNRWPRLAFIILRDFRVTNVVRNGGCICASKGAFPASRIRARVRDIMVTAGLLRVKDSRLIPFSYACRLANN